MYECNPDEAAGWRVSNNMEVIQSGPVLGQRISFSV
jgi:hypothetical protein